MEPLSTRRLKTILALKRRFGEAGYLIFPLSRNHRNNRFDIVAVRKNEPARFVFVRTKGKLVEIQPFGPANIYSKEKTLVAQVRKTASLPLRWNSSPKRFPKARKLEHAIFEYLGPNTRDQARLLLVA